MPELPEVETVRRGLAPVMVGKRVTAVTLRRKDLRFPFPPRFAAQIQGREVIALNRRAKYLLAELEDGQTLISHLGMSGSFRVESETPGLFHMARNKDPAHDHVVFDFENARITYNDPRRFGFMTLARTEKIEEHAYFANLGVEPLSNQFNAELLIRRFHNKRSSLKAALLDQRNVAGLGNIYVCEALHRSRLSPMRAAQDLKEKEAATLVRNIRSVLEDAIEAGGSSLRDHRQADGSLGYFQHNFRVYDREGQPCGSKACRGAILRLPQNGRSTFFCPECQN